jgi:hypothetical protein
MGVHGNALESAAIVCSYILASGFLRVRTSRTYSILYRTYIGFAPGTRYLGIVGLMCIFLY